MCWSPARPPLWVKHPPCDLVSLKHLPGPLWSKNVLDAGEASMVASAGPGRCQPCPAHPQEVFWVVTRNTNPRKGQQHRVPNCIPRLWPCFCPAQQAVLPKATRHLLRRGLWRPQALLIKAGETYERTQAPAMVREGTCSQARLARYPSPEQPPDQAPNPHGSPTPGGSFPASPLSPSCPLPQPGAEFSTEAGRASPPPA